MPIHTLSLKICQLYTCGLSNLISPEEILKNRVPKNQTLAQLDQDKNWENLANLNQKFCSKKIWTF